jgi:hypothetical protein
MSQRTKRLPNLNPLAVLEKAARRSSDVSERVIDLSESIVQSLNCLLHELSAAEGYERMRAYSLLFQIQKLSSFAEHGEWLNSGSIFNVTVSSSSRCMAVLDNIIHSTGRTDPVCIDHAASTKWRL